jgi:hypothetical protein
MTIANAFMQAREAYSELSMVKAQFIEYGQSRPCSINMGKY